ncbi:S8 family serine peptidase [Candidatus Poriferisodalis sp.]|uniref:S8 family serine peptidase n=1 Tax=Candidatus Poriferisodalis sp. TaxID=3101277 RepID=UPI003B01A0CD
MATALAAVSVAPVAERPASAAEPAAMPASASLVEPSEHISVPSSAASVVSEVGPPEQQERSFSVPGAPVLGTGFVFEGERVSPGVASLGWDEVPGASGHELMFRGPSGWLLLSEREPVGGVIVEFEGSSAVVGGLPEDVPRWRFAVRARNVYGVSRWSASAAVESPQRAAPEPVFDPFTSPTRSGIDLERLREAAATITPGAADCSAVPALDVEGVTVVDPPASLGDPDASLTVAEVVRVAGGCLVVEHVALAGRTVAQMRALLAADASVHAVGEPARQLVPGHGSDAHSHTGGHHNDSGLAAKDDVTAVQWHLPQPTMNALWARWNDDPGAQVIVAVLDTGMDITHPDFTENEDDPLVANTNHRIVEGRGCHVRDRRGHGTRMSGIIAAELGGGHVAGVAPEARIMPLGIKGLNVDSTGNDCSDPVERSAAMTPPTAIAAAVNGGARVINMSFFDTNRHDRSDIDVGGVGIPSTDTWELALRAATMLGVVAVAAAGNCGSDDVETRDINAEDDEKEPEYVKKRKWEWERCSEHNARVTPAVFDDVIAVAAINSDGNRTELSTSNEVVDVAAPGHKILTTQKACSSTHCVWESGGTSAASAFVSGVVALMLNRYPGATVGQVRRALEDSARHPTDVVRDDEYGHGIVDPAAAIIELGRLVDALGPVGSKGGFRSLSAGARHACGVRDNGAVSCWGLASVVDEVPDVAFRSLSSSPGADFVCGVRVADHAVQCWGDVPAEVTADVVGRRVLDTDGATALDGRFEKVAVGDRHVCGVRLNGPVVCWGDNAVGQTDSPWRVFTVAQANVTEIAAGGEHSCAVSMQTGLLCWGQILGSRYPPASSAVIARQIAAGAVNTCVIDEDHELECFGSNSRGVLDVPEGEFVSLDAGSHHMCAVSNVGSLRCWGDSADGRLAAPRGRYSQVAVGDRHACALSVYGRVRCWGHNGDGRAPRQGQLSSLSLTAGGVDLLSGRFSPEVTSYTVRTSETTATLRASADEVRTHSRICATSGRRRVCEQIDRSSPVALVDGDGVTIRVQALFGFGETRSYRIDISSPPRLDSLRLVPSGSGPQCSPQCPALALDPAFDSGVTGYRTVAGADVAELTVEYRAVNGTVRVLPEDAVPPLSGAVDPMPGHQVALGTDRGFASVSAGWGHSCGVKSGGSVACWGDDSAGESDAPSGSFGSVSAGGLHSCGVKSGGTAACWGDDSQGQASAPSGSFVSVSAGGSHSCGVKSDDSVVCWGDDSQGQASAPSGSFVSVSAGGLHSCGVKSGGTAACWGDDSQGQASAPSGSFVSVSAGGSHSCGVKSDDTVVCWGSDSWGQVSSTPSGSFDSVSAGDEHSCGLKSGGTVACWGHPDGGTAAPSGSVVSVSAGDEHSCAVTSGGMAVCWGYDSYGQAAAPSGAFGSVSAGSWHTCAVASGGSASCWGFPDDRASPPSGSFSVVSGGWWHSCGVKSDGTAACWGSDFDGRASPPSGSFSSVSADRFHSCGVKTDATAVCWGHNGDGQAGAPSGSFSSVSAGGFHSCGVKTDATVVCWGYNGDGRASAPSGSFSSVSAGGFHSCGVKTDATVVCWGYNDDGRASPPAGSFASVSAGIWHACGVRTDATVACWGERFRAV